MDLRGSVGHDGQLVQGCLANGQPDAAEYLASRGAPLDLESASGLGRVDEVKRLIDRVTRKEVLAAFSLACAYGRAPVIDFVLAHGGVDVDAELKSHGDGHTGLHVAAFHGQAEAVKVLLQHGANLHAIDKTWNTPPLLWALTGWQRSGHGGQYYEVVGHLVAAGARVTRDVIEWDKAQLDPEMLTALRTRPSSS